MKKILLLLVSVLFFNLSAQKRGKDYSNILKSNNIYEINAFLRDAHPDDPRRSVLKPRVMEMMKEYIKNAHPADQKVKDMQEMLALLRRRPSTKITFDEMNAIIKQKQIAKYKAELAAKQPTTVYTPSNAQNTFVVNTSANAAIPNAEAEEFNMLMAVSPVEHQNRTVKILNSLFDNDPNAKECIVMIQNKSDCNIIVRMEGVGTTKYRLAVPAHGEGSIVIQKASIFSPALSAEHNMLLKKPYKEPLL